MTKPKSRNCDTCTFSKEKINRYAYKAVIGLYNFGEYEMEKHLCDMVTISQATHENHLKSDFNKSDCDRAFKFVCGGKLYVERSKNK